MSAELSPSDEARRLAALRAYRLLDTAPDAALDDLTALAAEICAAPTASVTLVDEWRQWFISRLGLEVSETPRSVSFCAHVLTQRDLLVVPDAAQDERFAANPLVTGEPHIRFYAGAPLITSEGLVLGALCVIDRVPRTLLPGQEKALCLLARQVMAQFELRRHIREREESERLQKAIFEAEQDCLKLISASGRVQMMNEAGLHILEADSFAEVAGMDVFPLIHPEFREPVQALLDRVFAGETAALEFQLTGLKGTPRWLDLHAAPLRDEDGTVTSLVGVSRDITERKRTEARFRRLLDSNAQGVLFWNTRGEVTEANQAFLDMIGYSRQELEAGLISWSKLTPPESAKLDERALQQLAATGVCVPYEKEYLRKDGMRVPLLLGAAVFLDNKEEGVGFTVDLTERKKLERQVMQAQRMESISTLAQGIAHDLNNALAPIVTSIGLLQTHFDSPESRELLETIQNSARRGAAMVQQIFSFARGSTGERRELDLKLLLHETEQIVIETFLQKVRVRTEIVDDLWPVSGHASQLLQVLLNLCLNARDAMPDGGTITLTARNIELDAHDAGMIPEAAPGAYVILRVQDNGIGIPPEIVDRIFEPFFTTKPFGAATGLGLSTALGIVKSHGGLIRVHTIRDHGSQFDVFLPATSQTSPGKGLPVSSSLPRGAGELILIVDDDEAVRKITKRTLESFGYRVTLAAGATEAFTALGNQPTEIAAAIVDMNMPLFDGQTTIRVLRQMNPGLPVILSSGKQVDLKTLDLGVEHFLPKPYTTASLIGIIQRVLKE